ncbi:MAG: hypothetical protein ACRDPC_02465 [Solirubrobacteraceae bacterium]
MARYMIFARREYAESLELHGHLDADSEDAAAAAARDQLSGGGWIEVQLVPESEIRWVIRPAHEAAQREVEHA